MLRQPAKNRAVLLRGWFPRNDSGPKTGTGALVAQPALGLTSGGVLNAVPAERVAALLRPITKVGPRIMFGPVRVLVTASQTGTGALTARPSLTGVTGRNFFDVGSGDDLRVTTSVSNAISAGVNWTGTGVLAVATSLTNFAIVGVNGTAALAVGITLTSSGVIASPGSATGTGALVPGVTMSASAVRGFIGGGSMPAQITMTSTGTLIKASAGVLTVQASISGSGSSSVRWNDVPSNSGVWRLIPKPTATGN